MYKYQPTRKKDGFITDQLITAGHQKPLGKGQDVHEESEIQNYDIGTRLVMDDRVFRYCKAKGALLALKGGASDVMPREGAGDGVAYEIGDYEVTIPMNYEGDDFVIEQVAGYWNEGYYWAAPTDDGIGKMYRIKSSKVATTEEQKTELTHNEGYVKATLYESLKVRLPANSWITAWVNPYKTCVRKTTARQSIICQPLIAVQEGFYFWGQTWGPCFGQLHGSATGRVALDRTLFYHTNGAVMSGRSVVFGSSDPLPQIAGFIISCTRAWVKESGGAEEGGDQLYMLQLSP